MALALAAGPMRSLPLAMAYHWIGSFAVSILGLLREVVGG